MFPLAVRYCQGRLHLVVERQLSVVLETVSRAVWRISPPVADLSAYVGLSVLESAQYSQGPIGSRIRPAGGVVRLKVIREGLRMFRGVDQTSETVLPADERV